MTSAIDSPHFKALQKLKPVDTDEEDAAVALELDRALVALDSAYDESFPGTATDTLERWETLYGLSGEGSETERRTNLLVAVNANSGIAERYYLALATSLGFNIMMFKPRRIFRAGSSRAGFKTYSAAEQYTWNVLVCNSSETAGKKLVSAFEAQKIPFTVIRWIWNFEQDEDGTPSYDENGELQYDEDQEEVL